jgi:hypothetical protein
MLSVWSDLQELHGKSDRLTRARLAVQAPCTARAIEDERQMLLEMAERAGSLSQIREKKRCFVNLYHSQILRTSPEAKTLSLGIHKVAEARAQWRMSGRN